jgi:AraC family transcriptional regulator
LEWLKRLNRALDYIEEHLEDTVQFDEAAKITCCSTFHFQRMFSYLAGVPLSEYIRRRRMTLAAFALQQQNVRVIDLALRYGYDSPTAFNRAFQSVHGVPPSVARKTGVPLHTYPRISFHISIKGDVNMDYRIEKKEAFRIMGVKTPLDSDWEKTFQTVPQFWQKVDQTNTIPTLFTLMDGGLKALLGVCVIANDTAEYYIAVVSDQPLPDEHKDFAAYTVPAGTWAVFPGNGTMPDAVQQLKKRIIMEWLPESGYDYASAPDIEVYLTEKSQNTNFEIWLPIIKKN